MIDLTNKNVDEINSLILKYGKILELVKPQEIPYLAYIIDVAIKYIDEKYINLNKNLKVSIVVILKKMLTKIVSESDIKMIVDEFIKYYNNEYIEFSEDSTSDDEAEKEYCFLSKFVKDKSW